jgi:CHAT domain-containing protein
VEITLAAHHGLGETCAAKGDDLESLRHLQLAIEAIESLRGRIPTPELKADFVQQNWKAYEDAIYVLSRLHHRDPDKGFDRQAFYYAEKGRARSFLDLLAESRARITKGLTAAQQQQEASLFAELSKASAALLRQASEPNTQAVRKAEENLSQWAIELRRTNPQYQDLQYPEPDDSAKVQSALAGTGIAILEYTLGERQSFVWAISASRMEMLTLPGRKQIEKDVASLRAITTRPPKGTQSPDALQAAKNLYARLMAPVEKSIQGAKRVLIVPDGILYYLPFEALIRHTAPKPRYLIEDYTIAYAPSASVFVRLSAEKRRNNRRRRELLAYGDPLFDVGGLATGNIRMGDLVRGVYEANGMRLAPLPNTRAEVENIGRLYPADRRKIYLGARATEASVKQEKLTEYKRLHFATHAVIDEQAPARSGVVLSLVNTGREDGILRAGEIFNLDLDADLVVLSACQTGLGKLVKGEGMVGLTRAFLYAGTPRVLVSLWEVNDLATTEFMTLFYAKMKEVQSTASALREVKLAMIHSPSLAYRHPYFWTPFVLTGTF